MISTRTTYWGVAILSLLIAVSSLRAFVLPMELVMPDMADYAKRIPLAVWGHVLFGPIVLALVPIQLSDRIRLRRPSLHRISGRVYAFGVLVASVASMAIIPGSIASPFARLGFAVLACLWIGFTALGLMAIRRGDYAAHQRWMIRSIAMTFAAVTLRLIMAPLMAMGWTVAETYNVTAWLSWMLNLLAVEVILRNRLRVA